MSKNNSSRAIDNDEDADEATDMFKSMKPLSGRGSDGTSGRRKATSDITGLVVGVSSEYLTFLRQPGVVNEQATEGQIGSGRVRQNSNDIVQKSGYAPVLRYDDLALAEAVIKKGTKRERQISGITQQDFMKEVEGEKPEAEFDFKFNHNGLTTAEAERLLEIHGRNELPEKSDPKWLIFLRQFWAPMPIMIWIAIIIEAGIQNFIDMGILLVIQFTNATISFYETNKAGNAIAALKNSLKPQATVKRDGKWQNIDARILVPTDTVLLASGSAVPADCRVNTGEIDVDQAALTGESLPVTFYKGDSCKMGSTVVRGEVEGTVEFTGVDTFFGKTASLLQETHELSHLQVILMRVRTNISRFFLVCFIRFLTYFFFLTL
jgi:magnesium-transporting ATPase (P-type)